MKNKLRAAYCLILLVIIVCVCIFYFDKTEMKYADTANLKQNYEEKQENLDVQISDFDYDDKSYRLSTLGYTYDSDYLYLSRSAPWYIINLKSGRVETMCKIPGCKHLNEPSCTDSLERYSCVATGEGIYFIREGKLWLRTDDKEKELFEGDFYTEFEELYFPDSPSDISSLLIRDNDIYLLGPTFFYIYDRESGEVSEPVKMNSDSACLGFVVTDEWIYYINAGNELFGGPIETMEFEKLEDMVTGIEVYDNKLYYVKWNSELGSGQLYVSEKDSVGELLLEQCYVNFVIADTGIYYQKNINDDRVYLCDHNGNPLDEIQLTNPDTNELIVGIIDMIPIRGSGMIAFRCNNHFFLYNETDKTQVIVETDLYD